MAKSDGPRRIANHAIVAGSSWTSGRPPSRNRSTSASLGHLDGMSTQRPLPCDTPLLQTDATSERERALPRDRCEEPSALSVASHEERDPPPARRRSTETSSKPGLLGERGHIGAGSRPSFGAPSDTPWTLEDANRSVVMERYGSGPSAVNPWAFRAKQGLVSPM
jgi:hypothetical protein